MELYFKYENKNFYFFSEQGIDIVCKMLYNLKGSSWYPFLAGNE